jgi:hypothetical protein
MDGPLPPQQQDYRNEADVPSLAELARNVRGAAQLLGLIAGVPDTSPSLRAGLELLAGTLRHSADQADSLIDDVGIDISDQLGITTTDLANMRFSAVAPPFRRETDTLAAWKKVAEAEFNLWGEVEEILAEDDVGLERRFQSAPDDHLDLVDSLERLRERWQHDMKLVEATLLRLAVSVARWEESGNG